MVSELLEDVSLETIAEKDLMESTQGKEGRGFDRNNFSAIHETQLLLVLVLLVSKLPKFPSNLMTKIIQSTRNTCHR